MKSSLTFCKKEAETICTSAKIILSFRINSLDKIINILPRHNYLSGDLLKMSVLTLLDKIEIIGLNYYGFKGVAAWPRAFLIHTNEGPWLFKHVPYLVYEMLVIVNKGEQSKITRELKKQIKRNLEDKDGKYTVDVATEAWFEDPDRGKYSEECVMIIRSGNKQNIMVKTRLDLTPKVTMTEFYIPEEEVKKINIYESQKEIAEQTLRRIIMQSPTC